MSVVITNISKHDDAEGLNQYVVRINNGPVIAEFHHIRRDGLAECLRQAAGAVDLAENIDRFVSAYKAQFDTVPPIIGDGPYDGRELATEPNGDIARR